MSWDDYFAADAGGAEAEGRGKKRTVTVGWTVRFGRSDAIWGPPKTFSRSDPKAKSAKSIQACPAAIDFDRRHS